jgi:hypothetical protein
MDSTGITGPQKAAVLLFSLGEDVAAEIARNLDDGELKKLGASMARVFSLSTEVIDSVFAEFQTRASTTQRIPLNPGERSQFLRNVISKAVRGEKGQALLDEIQQKGKWNLFQKVRKLDAKTLANFIQNEHPQTIAVVLANLDAGQTAATRCSGLAASFAAQPRSSGPSPRIKNVITRRRRASPSPLEPLAQGVTTYHSHAGPGPTGRRPGMANDRESRAEVQEQTAGWRRAAPGRGFPEPPDRSNWLIADRQSLTSGRWAAAGASGGPSARCAERAGACRA